MAQALGFAVLVLVGLVLAARARGMSKNVEAFLALIRHIEAGGDYQVIAGGDRFNDFSEHPFILDPERSKPLGTTAAGAYQMVRRTWMLARDNLGLSDFSPASQDAAAQWLIKFKVPGENAVAPEGTGNYELVEAGRFDEAIQALRREWEAFDRMAKGEYHVSLADARSFLQASGGVVA